jgi:hypothetical protein
MLEPNRCALHARSRERACRFGRRAAFGVGAALVGAAGRARAGAGPVPVRPVAIELGGRALCTPEWLDDQWAEATRVFATADVALERRPLRTSGAGPVDVVTRADRDAFAAALEPGVVNAFLVASLADVDEPGRMRKGVHWRAPGRPDLHYVIVIATAPRGVLAHELGHFLGLAHAAARDNLMSYARSEGGTLFLDRDQRARVAASARALTAALASRGR